MTCDDDVDDNKQTCDTCDNGRKEVSACFI